jgi:hypothetical protein
MRQPTEERTIRAERPRRDVQLRLDELFLRGRGLAHAL